MMQDYSFAKQFPSGQYAIYHLQEVDGQIWAASDNGVQIYDPKTYTVAKTIPGFTYSIKVHNGVAWFGGDGELRLYDIKVRPLDGVDMLE